ncbi:biopolymer transporter ExbD [Helicobacter sp. MIT 00-7814]|uniref:biopolymer transporter ExbD n=1 Tax=unclassified Helicobacter TaxID=2593540 RepID=UPI000E1EA667|nr:MULTISPECIES: biopolymer transporter ExbD [unclassified Helicobacter]RDU53691.1 biopolymer transporter ExbD [Helicobacter sp. MIT 99-10781]RDU54077.1 biopolymer transporter ExbD [Helicobacter sp. MIT 00-7814]
MKKIDSLNLIPFIDIMLVLLVIVLVSASFVQHSKIQVEIPTLEDQKQGATSSESKEKIITIDKEGNYYFEDSKISLESLKNELSRLPKDTQIIIQGDKASELEFFLELSTTLQAFGLHDIYVIMQKAHE